MIVSKVGVEVEFLLRNAKGEIIIPPRTWDRDGFPLLGEIRGAPGKAVAETLIGYETARLELIGRLRSGHTIDMVDSELIRLALYKKANKEINWDEKAESMGKVKNIHGIEIEDFSDQVVKNNKIQGIRVSCGLHIHFSCAVTDEWEYEEEQYELVTLPVGFMNDGVFVPRKDMGGTADTVRARELTVPTIYLYNQKGYKKKKKMTVTASRLNKPAVHYIVSEMDKAFFEALAAPEKERTKFRQPGFYELKPYGFEYRSLPANSDSMMALPDIVCKAFALLKEVNEY